jgi:hypothetical protein
MGRWRKNFWDRASERTEDEFISSFQEMLAVMRRIHDLGGDPNIKEIIDRGGHAKLSLRRGPPRQLDQPGILVRPQWQASEIQLSLAEIRRLGCRPRYDEASGQDRCRAGDQSQECR